MDWFRFFLAALILATVAVVPFPTGLLLVDAPLHPRFTITGYDRQAHFGATWAMTPTGCDTRQLALADEWGESCGVPAHAWDPRPITDPVSYTHLTLPTTPYV